MLHPAPVKTKSPRCPSTKYLASNFPCRGYHGGVEIGADPRRSAADAGKKVVLTVLGSAEEVTEGDTKDRSPW